MTEPTNLRDRLQKAIRDQAPVWEQTFDDGPGDVCSVSDAAVVTAHMMGPEIARLRDENESLRAVLEGWRDYRRRVGATRREYSAALRAALDLPEEDRARHIPHLIEKVNALRLDYSGACIDSEYVFDRLADMVDDAGLARPENLASALDAVSALSGQATESAAEVAAHPYRAHEACGDCGQERSAHSGEVLTVSWHENAIRGAVDRALAIVRADDTDSDDVYRVNGKAITWTDLACLVDAGRAVLGDSDNDNRANNIQPNVTPAVSGANAPADAEVPPAATLPGIYPSSPAPTSPHYRTGNRNPRNLYQVNSDGTETHFGCTFHEHAGPLVVEALNQWEQRKQAVARVKEKASTPRLQWHHGPTASDPDPGKIWHTGCGGELLCIDGGLICDCGAQEQGREACELPPDWRTQVAAVSSWTADEVVALVEEWQAGA